MNVHNTPKLIMVGRLQPNKSTGLESCFLEYTKDDDGHLIIDPEQAEIVKLIYREYLEGSSMDKIADGLMADGILTSAGKTKWHTRTINKILRNEKSNKKEISKLMGAIKTRRIK